MKFAKNSMNLIETGLAIVIISATLIAFILDHSNMSLHEQVLGNIDRYAVVKISLMLMSLSAVVQLVAIIIAPEKKASIEARLIATLSASFGFNLLAIISLSTSSSDDQQPNIIWLFYFFMSFISALVHLNIRGGVPINGPNNS